MAKTLFDKITEIYPELSTDRTAFHNFTIVLQDDGDEVGAYIAKWEYDKPIPEGLSLGKPSV
jgi:hypothetical protein